MNAKATYILVLNPGSATLKFSLYRQSARAVEGIEQIVEGMVDRLGSAQAELRLAAEGESPIRESAQAAAPAQAAEIVLDRLRLFWQSENALEAVGCRVVHGGARFVEPTQVTPSVLEEIRALSRLAPLHNLPTVGVLEACLRRLPDVPVIAVFDTAFHATLPEVARVYALPRELCARYDLRRYGFHGTAHRYVAERLQACLGGAQAESRYVICHLGSGASVCAVRNGRSVDTSMGLTPMEGLVMGTRSGDVDPGLLLHLLREVGMTPDELDDLLNRRSGLLGLSGRSADMRDLERAAAEGDAASELALEIYAYRVAKYIGAYAVALEGLDAVAFSGGVGERSAPMRARICRRLGLLGLALDEERNRAADGRQPARISRDGSWAQGWVIPVDENLQIAREIRRRTPER